MANNSLYFLMIILHHSENLNLQVACMDLTESPPRVTFTEAREPMTVQRIDRVQERQQIHHVEAEQTQRRLNLFTANSFERVDSVRFTDGATLAIPTMTERDREEVAKLFANIPPEKQPVLNQASVNFGDALYNETKVNPAGVKVGSFSSGLVDAANQSLETFVVTTGKTQADDAAKGVIFMGLVGLEGNLADMAKGVEAKTQLAADMRTDIAELREALSDWPDDGSKKSFTWTENITDKDGNVITVTREGELTKEEAQALMEKLDGQLSSLRDMTELDRYDLQTKVQDYQQALQTLTEMMKAQHDQLMRTIANLKA